MNDASVASLMPCVASNADAAHRPLLAAEGAKMLTVCTVCTEFEVVTKRSHGKVILVVIRGEDAHSSS